MNILVPYEDEATAQLLIDHVSSYIWADGSHFKLLHAVEPLDIDDFACSICGQTEHRRILEHRVTRAQELSTKLMEKLQKTLPASMKVTSEVIVGKAAEVILATAKNFSADQIVMGSHSKNAISRIVLGSVSSKIATCAPCTLTIVRTDSLPLSPYIDPITQSELPVSMRGYQSSDCQTQ